MFGYAAKHYNLYAHMQAYVSERLLRDVIQRHENIKTLDIGCGTGLTTDSFIKKHASSSHVIGLDMSSRMCAEYRKNTHYPCVQADMRMLSFKDNTFNNIISSIAIHWLHSAYHREMFAHIARICRPDAHIHIAVPVQGTLQRFYAMLDSASGHRLRHFTFPEGHKLVSDISSHLKITSAVIEPYREVFTHPLQMLRYTKNIGANITTAAAGEHHYPGKKIFNNFARIFSQTDEVHRTLDWQILYIHATVAD